MPSAPRNLIAIFLISAFPSASVARPMDSLIHFKDPYHCIVGKDFEALLGGVIRWEKTGDSYAGKLASPRVPATFRNQVGKPQLSVTGSEYRATLSIQGSWRGLPLHSLIVIQWVESESGFYLVFDATREEVLEAANKEGFRIPQSGSEYRDGDPIGVNVGVSVHEGRGALYCIDG
jgi:hypothetical protein